CVRGVGISGYYTGAFDFW
nr:immunoglobulin heavy chain junction region [Macaca mulatta]